MPVVCILGGRKAGFINAIVDRRLPVLAYAYAGGEGGRYVEPRVDVVDCSGEPGGVVGCVFVRGVNEVVEFGV